MLFIFILAKSQNEKKQDVHIHFVGWNERYDESLVDENKQDVHIHFVG